MADRIQPTPRNKLLGLLADSLSGVYDYAQRPDPTMPMGLANPVLGLLADALPLRAGANVLDDLSYGQAPIRGTGMTTRLTPDATELAMAAAPFPKTSGKAALAALGAVDAGASGLGKAAIVWHGSPHKFNAFDASKIGTGEGAQAYGHGLYLAESPEVARQYRHALSAAQDLVMSREAINARRAKDEAARWQAMLDNPFSDRPVLFRTGEPVDDAFVSKQLQAELAELARSSKRVAEWQPGGALYKVDLPDNKIAQMLDWDKPLSQQAPAVQSWARGLIEQPGDPYNLQRFLSPKNPNGGPLGSELYEAATLGGAAKARALIRDGQYVSDTSKYGERLASDSLRQQGIPGIRYLDGGSRGVGAGTSNFVVFPGEENALTILERNGRSLLD